MRSLLGAPVGAEVIHILTGEYPPDAGGVGGHTAQLAGALVAHGQEVDIWTRGSAGTERENGITVHRVGGSFRPLELARLERHFDSIPGPLRILVQWTPHSFGMRSLNAAFPAWLWKRAAVNHDRIEVIVHEAFIAFGEGKWRRDAAALVQRAMAFALLQAASKAWITIPKWEEALRPWAFGKQVPFEWLPVPSNIAPVANVGAIVEIRRRMTQFRRPLIGHFGTFRRDIENLLVPALLELQGSQAIFLLIGRGSQEARWRMVIAHPELSRRVFATGELDSAGIAAHLSACDVLLQPYPDGISTRRGSAMAALSLGVPVVTNLGLLSEAFWSGGGAIEIADSWAAESLKAATLNLIRDHERRVQMSAEARALYQNRFHIRHTVAALMRAEPVSHHKAHATA